MKGSFHGRLFGTLAVTDRPAFRDQFEPVMPGVHFVAPDDVDALRAAVSAERTAAIIVEPVQGEGGVQPLSTEYLRALREVADRGQCGADLRRSAVRPGPHGRRCSRTSTRASSPTS